ncbi:NAD(P)-dependent oxidoreductase [uncultured Alsobacter sp.]|uniref:NAD-dependent epimerase/dehydratase family protein n=1 Tax=uncultured Alsobacter sp. TaxID=1748258 RepID=UPI0025D2D4CE|nr:NAD(P)-dependent oxidoreductase [uncultured Alsobacter sp.]
MAERVVITGGAGFVAIHAAEVALSRGIAVTLVDVRDPPPELARLVPGATMVRADIRDAEQVAGACPAGVPIIHCAALVGPQAGKAEPYRALEINVMGTARLLERVRDAGGRLVHVSTATLYGHRPDLAVLSEDDHPSPLGIYDASKLMSETLCTQYRATYGVQATSVRTGFVFGFGSRIGEYFIPRVLAGEAVREPCGRDHPCDFTCVEDLAEGLVAAACAQDLPEPVYNVTGGRLHTRGDFAEAVRRALPQANIEQGPGVDPARHLRGACDIGRARRDLGYRPRQSLDSGIAGWIKRARGAVPAPMPAGGAAS